MKKSKHFKIQELVCPEVYKKYGERAWMFIDPELIETLDIIREKILNKPMIVNNWASGGGYTQRGLRCNICQLVRDKTKNGKLYLSAHNFGKAIDATVEGMTAEEARRLIIKNQILLHIRFVWRMAFLGCTWMCMMRIKGKCICLRYNSKTLNRLRL